MSRLTDNRNDLKSPSRQPWLNMGRIAVSATLLAWILSRVGLDQLAAALRGADWPFYFAAIGVEVGGVMIRTLRWLVLLKAAGAGLTFRRAVYLYFVGAFFNTFLPTGFGGDVVRVLDIGAGATSPQAAGTVFIDRLSGFIVLFALALTALPFLGSGLLPHTTWLIALMGMAVLGGSVLLFEGRILRRLTGRLAAAAGALPPDAGRLRRAMVAINGWLAQTGAVIGACGGRALVAALAASLVFNILHIGAHALIARALHLNISIWIFCAFVPLTATAMLVPITVSGLGVREGIYVVLFGQVSLSEAQALALSIGVYTLDLAMGIIGGVIYLINGIVGLGRSQQPEANERQ